MNLRHGFLLVIAMLLAAPVRATDPFLVPDINFSEILGTWTCRYWSTRHTITFAEDGTFKGICLIDNKITDRYEGEFGLISPYVGAPQIKWKYSKSNSIPAGTVDVDKIEILNHKLLVVWTKEGYRHAYQRFVPSKKE